MVTSREPRTRAQAQAQRAAMADVEVRPMRRRHLPSVLAIEELVYPKPWSQRLFASEISQPDSRCYLVAVVKPGRVWRRRRVVGYAGVMVAVGEAHITTVATHPHHHRRKIASHLLVELLRRARSMGAEAATLEVRVNNRGAQRLYAGFGFAPVGVRRRYYGETGEDALIMWAYDLHSDAYSEILQRQAARLSLPGGDSGAADLHVPWVQQRVGLPSENGD